MADKPTVVSCVLAVLAGVCFVTGVSLLTDEGREVGNGACEETNFNN